MTSHQPKDRDLNSLTHLPIFLPDPAFADIHVPLFAFSPLLPLPSGHAVFCLSLAFCTWCFLHAMSLLSMQYMWALLCFQVLAEMTFSGIVTLLTDSYQLLNHWTYYYCWWGFISVKSFLYYLLIFFIFICKSSCHYISSI